MSEALNILVTYLYCDLGQTMGGPLHIVLDDGNVDDHWVARAQEDDYFASLWDGTFEECTNPGERTDAYHRTAIQTVCRAILAILRGMTEPERQAAVHEAWEEANP